MRRERLAWLLLTMTFGLGWAPVSMAGTPTPFAPPSETALVAYRGATLIDGLGAPPRRDMTIIVKGERIERILPDHDLDPRVAATAKMVDLHGLFVLPGLIDSHVHLATPPNRQQAEAVLRRDLYGGVTAVRDMADDLRSVADITRATLVGEIAGPDVYYAALMAGPDFFTDNRTIQVSAGGVPGHVPWMQAVTDKTDLPLAVAQARGTFATAIKLYADLSPDLAARITAEAHRQKLLVWSHATLYPAKPSEVVAAGADAISHACLLVREPMDHVPGWTEPHAPVQLETFRDGRDPALAQLFADMVRRGTILDATIWVYSSDTAASTTLPSLPPGSCDDMIGGAITGQAYRAGVTISAGTDNLAPAAGPWPDLFHELDALATKAKMPASAVIQAATLNGARATGQERDMGSITPGKLANMVVLNRNPLDGVENFKSVVMTIKRGHVFKRSAFIPLAAGDITDF